MQLAIDIGTHTARAAYLDQHGRPQLVSFSDGTQAFPALARQTINGLVLGTEAAAALVGNQETTVIGCTSLMGRTSSLPVTMTQRLPHPVRVVGDEMICDLLYAEVGAAEIYGQIARQLADAATRHTGMPVDGMIVCVPAGAEDRFRIQARAAVEAHGLAVRRLINQPTAALLALPTAPAANHTIAVVSCTGGMTEVSLVAQSPAGVRVLAVAVDSELGGDGMAWTVAEQLNQRFRQTAQVDVFAVGDSKTTAFGLRTAAEQVLERLALAHTMTLVLDHGGGFGRDLVTQVSRQDVEYWLHQPYTALRTLCQRCLTSARLTANQVDKVVLIGDWTSLPGLAETIAEQFARNLANVQIERPAELAVLGAALAGAGNSPLIWDVTPYPLGINCFYGEIERFSPIIRANTAIPTAAVGADQTFTEHYTTRFPDQTSVRLDVLQYRGPRNAEPRGPEPVTPAQCERLGSWEFGGLRPRRGTCAAFTVTFAIDQNGILQLIARETATGRTLTAQVERGIG